MNQKMKRIWSILLCFLLLIGTNSGYIRDNQIHSHAWPEFSYDDHDHDEHDSHNTVDLLSICENILEFSLSLFAMPVYAAYEDGVECEFCGGWRYDDWKCDNGDHCGDGAD